MGELQSSPACRTQDKHDKKAPDYLRGQLIKILKIFCVLNFIITFAAISTIVDEIEAYTHLFYYFMPYEPVVIPALFLP